MTKPDYAREAFDTNYDYEFAAEQKKNPQKGLVQVLGERAIKWFRGMNDKRKAEKAERKYNGSLAEISDAIEPSTRTVEPVVSVVEQPAPHLTPHAMPEAGMYRSMHAIHSMEEQAAENREGPYALDDEMAELMRGAVKRARAHIANDNLTQTATMRPVSPEDHPHEEHAPQDDDQLVGAGK